ncbi:hypothetical protein pb186bvf_020196 [Paramecium bursaria]
MQQENLNKSSIKQQNQQQNPEQRQQRQEKIIKLKKVIQKMKDKIKHTIYYRKFLKKSKAKTYEDMQQLKMNYKEAQQILKESDKSLVHQLEDYQNQQTKISQQKKRLESDYSKFSLERQQQYLLNRTIQELKDYNILISANFDELKNLIYKEDFDQIQQGSQYYPYDPSQQNSVNLLEQQFSDNRKRLIKATILWHLFFYRQELKIKKHQDDQRQIKEKKDKFTKKLNELSQLNLDNIREQNKKEKALKELNDKRLELDQQCAHLRQYITLRKTKQQILNAKTQLDTFIQNKQQVNQKILSLIQQMKITFDDTVEEVHKNIQDDNEDFKGYFADTDNKENEVKQLINQRSELIKSQNSIQNFIKEDKSDEQIIKLLQLIEKHTPQIKKFTEQEILKCLGEKKEKMDSIDADNKINQNCLDFFKKSIAENHNSQREHQIKIQELDKEIKGLDQKINTDRQQIILINVKFDELKQNLSKNPEELIQDISRYNAYLEHLIDQIQEVYNNIMDDFIRKIFQEFVLGKQTNGANKPENIHYRDLRKDHENYINKQNEQLLELQMQENKIKYEIDKIKESNSKIAQIQQITNQAKILKKSIMSLKNEYKAYQRKLVMRWKSFYKLKKIRLEQEEKLKFGK